MIKFFKDILETISIGTSIVRVTKVVDLGKNCDFIMLRRFAEYINEGWQVDYLDAYILNLEAVKLYKYMSVYKAIASGYLPIGRVSSE